MKNFVDAAWVSSCLNDDKVKIIDCRFNSTFPEYGLEAYLKYHIPKARFLDVNKDLAGKEKTHGGFRPLPEINQLIEKLENIGITNDTTVIIYDEFLNSAPRLWWMLKYLGHASCYVLNGGINEWKAQGYSLSRSAPVVSLPSKYTSTINDSIVCDIEYVNKKKGLDTVALVDAREYERYAGIHEPLYAKAGHIPGALCKSWRDCIDNGFIKGKELLKNTFGDLLKYEEVIFYCGSGVAACGDFLILDELGKTSKVYIGSFTDWISYKENEVAVLV